MARVPDLSDAFVTLTAAMEGNDVQQLDTAAEVLARTLAVMAGADADPRPGQAEAVELLVEQRRRLLVVQATGWGKSMVYWAATAAMRERGYGPTVVISPLLALMRDQIAAAAAVGLRAATVNSANVNDWNDVFEELRQDRVDVLLVSPERLANPKFADRAMPLLAKAGLLVIDEAHCISDWGFDFRPDYQRVTHLLLHLGPDTPVLATTATANQRVTNDVAQQLGDQTHVLRGPLARTSLQLSVVPGLGPVERMAWVDDALSTLPGSGIVYCLTVQEAQSLADFLTSRGHRVAAYTGQTDPAERHRIEDALRRNEVKAVVATSALGMGYDKPDLAFCIHVGSPSSPVAYYQQVGRAGRQIAHAHGILLPAGDADDRIWEYFAEATLPDPDSADRVLEALSPGPASLSDLEAATGVRRGKLDLLLKQLRVDGAVDRDGSAWRSTGQGWVYDAAKYDQVRKTRRAEANLMRQYATGSRCLMLVLIDALDDPRAEPCGRCSVCTGTLPTPGQQPSEPARQSALTYLQQRAHHLQPRKIWPKAVSRRGRISGAEPGRALCFAHDPGWPHIVAELRSPDAAPSPELVTATLNLLAQWNPGDLDAIVTIPIPGQQQRTNGLAEAISTHVGVPLVEAFTRIGPPVPAGLASTAHVEYVEEHLIPAPITLPGRVLLLAASGRSMWTTTVAAATLREQGANEVLPLIVHQLP